MAGSRSPRTHSGNRGCPALGEGREAVPTLQEQISGSRLHLLLSHSAEPYSSKTPAAGLAELHHAGCP